MAEPDGAADLYGLELPEFTAARDALAKRLRAAGERGEADRIKKLRRPSLTTWALNQAARRHHDLVDGALEAGAALRSATMQALEGDASKIRETQQAERHAVDRAVSAAATILEAAGHPPTESAKVKMADTIRAAFVDDDVADRLRGGVLDRDHQAAGFGLGGGSMPADRTATPSKTPAEMGSRQPVGPVEPDRPAKPDQPTDQLARPRAKRRATELSARSVEQAARATELRDAAEQAQLDAAEARRAAEQAAQRAADAEGRASHAERQAAEAERQAADAQAEADAAMAGADLGSDSAVPAENER